MMEKVSLFKERLSEAMSEANISQSELARAIGCHRSVINVYLSGRNKANAEIHLKLSQILKVNPDWLEGYDVSKSPDNKATSIHKKIELLNNEGKKKTEEYIDDLLINPKYRKDDNAEPTAQKIVA